MMEKVNDNVKRHEHIWETLDWRLHHQKSDRPTNSLGSFHKLFTFSHSVYKVNRFYCLWSNQEIIENVYKKSFLMSRTKPRVFSLFPKTISSCGRKIKGTWTFIFFDVKENSFSRVKDFSKTMFVELWFRISPTISFSIDEKTTNFAFIGKSNFIF